MTEDGPVVNAMTVDVEDYFQVSAFDRVVDRAAWDRMDSRVERNTRRLLDLFDEFGTSATFWYRGRFWKPCHFTVIRFACWTDAFGSVRSPRSPA